MRKQSDKTKVKLLKRRVKELIKERDSWKLSAEMRLGVINNFAEKIAWNPFNTDAMLSLKK